MPLNVALNNALETNGSLIRAEGHRLDVVLPAEPIVAVPDSGDGIAPEQLPQLFKFFSRGRSSGR